MGQPDIQNTFNSSVSVEGFEQIYQAEPMEAQGAPDVAQADPGVELKTAPDQIQADPDVDSQSVQNQEALTDPSKGVSLDEAAKVLGLHMDTVRKRLQKGKIKGFKVADKFGEKWLVHIDEIAHAKAIQGCPTFQGQIGPEQIQNDPIVEVEIAPDQVQAYPGQAQGNPTYQAQPDPEYQRLMSIIESQAHQLRAAGDVIVYLRSEVDEAKTQLTLLTDSQHAGTWWARFCSWFVGRR